MSRASILGPATALLLSAYCGPAAAQSAKVVNKFNDWTLYAHEAAQAKVCFSLAPPRSSEPAAARRDPVYFYVSAWPKEGVKSEVSVKIGYPFKKGTNVTVTVGTTAFKLFTKDDKAFVGDPGDELKLLDAMKKGSSMVVEGVSERGTVTKDTYSLAGLGQALQSLATACP